jgi:phosphate transport system permease protein
MSRNRRRTAVSQLARALISVCTTLALVPLALVLLYVVIQGLPSLSDGISFLLNSERPEGVPGGGVANALVGTTIMVGLAAAVAAPFGILVGVHLAIYGRGRKADLIRICTDALAAAPSIAVGMFVYAILVAPSRHFSGYAGALALAVLMLPLIVRTAEGAVARADADLREPGLALGLPLWRVVMQLILPAALAAVLTGVLLALARAAGETAPLLFTSLGNQLLTSDPLQPMSALPLVVFHDALTAYPDLQRTAWGAALLLVMVVMAVNILCRTLLARRQRL